jgi:hypothetical protein
VVPSTFRLGGITVLPDGDAFEIRELRLTSTLLLDVKCEGEDARRAWDRGQPPPSEAGEGSAASDLDTAGNRRSGRRDEVPTTEALADERVETPKGLRTVRAHRCFVVPDAI